MTEDAYFHGDPSLCKAYREAWKNKQQYQEELLNWAAWIMGGYVYQTLCLTAPTFNSLKPQRPGSYLKKPLGFEKEDEPIVEGPKDLLLRWAAKVNRKYE